MKDTKTIYTDIPLPEKRHGQRHSKFEKFATMEVGQCVFVDTRKEANSLRNYLLGRGMKLATRKVDDQIGIWRLPDE